MKKKSLVAILITLFIIPQLVWSQVKAQDREFYQLSVYHYNSSEQEKILDSYLQTALIPALHSLDIKSVGVFKAIANDTAVNKTMYVLIPIKSLNAVDEISEMLLKDEKFKSDSKEYANTLYNSPAYSRIETMLLKAFSATPVMKFPQLNSPKNERVYELRSYESASEKIFRKKVHMFNEGGETEIFKKLNFNAVFYSEVIAGGKMPNLMYMTTFENKEDRDAHWASFRDDADWANLKSKPEYQNNVSRNETIFLRPTDYSDY